MTKVDALRWVYFQANKTRSTLSDYKKACRVAGVFGLTDLELSEFLVLLELKCWEKKENAK